MYFTKVKQRAFELLMQQKPGFDRYQSLLPRQKDAENARQHGQIDGQKPLCHAALQTRKRQRAYCNTKTAENGFLIVHAYQERK